MLCDVYLARDIKKQVLMLSKKQFCKCFGDEGKKTTRRFGLVLRRDEEGKTINKRDIEKAVNSYLFISLSLKGLAVVQWLAQLVLVRRKKDLVLVLRKNR